VLSLEGLVLIAENGRAEPLLADHWALSHDGLTLNVHLRPRTTFHDGTAVTSAVVAEVLSSELKQRMGPAFDDLDRIVAAGDDAVEIRLKRPTPFAEEALDVDITKPGDPAMGTGPFRPSTSTSAIELRRNPAYHQGPPVLDRIHITNYPTVRAAWADMLRGNIEMLYEVGADSVDLMQDAASVRVYRFTRHYQFVVALNVESAKLRSPEVRRALNLAIDRAAVVRDAFGGHGVPSSGPVWPRHWVFNDDLPRMSFDPKRADALLTASGLKPASNGASRLTIKCLVPPDAEHLALVIKRQLEAVGVTLELEQVSYDQIVRSLRARSYETVLLDGLGGPSLFRMYTLWRSGGPYNPGALGSPVMDAALDGLRHAASERDYRRAVAALQQSAVDDPAAIFLAWGERARAVSSRFDVPAEPERDIFSPTLRLWRPIADERLANRN
jgi:peptide/nickel transport system substrate-binding protein